MTNKEAIKILKDPFADIDESVKAYRMAIKALEAEAKPVVRGEWIMKWHSFFGQEVPHCSICQSGSVLKSRYCPNCGAEMGGEEDELHK